MCKYLFFPLLNFSRLFPCVGLTRFLFFSFLPKSKQKHPRLHTNFHPPTHIHTHNQRKTPTNSPPPGRLLRHRHRTRTRLQAMELLVHLRRARGPPHSAQPSMDHAPSPLQRPIQPPSQRALLPGHQHHQERLHEDRRRNHVPRTPRRELVPGRQRGRHLGPRPRFLGQLRFGRCL